ncbi:hypothetical protein V6N13_071629 [Hibiscus sabdariffa]
MGTGISVSDLSNSIELEDLVAIAVANSILSSRYSLECPPRHSPQTQRTLTCEGTKSDSQTMVFLYRMKMLHGATCKNASKIFPTAQPASNHENLKKCTRGEKLQLEYKILPRCFVPVDGIMDLV